jgi:hypothetical protein
VELTRFCDEAGAEDGEDPVAWHAEWALQGDSVATEDSGTDVSELIDGDAAAQWASRYDLTIERNLIAGDPLRERQTVEGILNGLGVTLPRTVPAPPRLGYIARTGTGVPDVRPRRHLERSTALTA